MSGNGKEEVVIVRMKQSFSKEEVETFEAELSKKLDKKVVILDGKYGEIEHL